MTRFAEAVLRHRRLISVLWVMLFLVGGATAGLVTDRLVVDYSLPDQPGYETEQQIVDTYGQSARDPLVAVVTAPDGQAVEDARDEVGAIFGAVRSQVPDVRVVDYASTGDRRFITDDGRSTFGLIYVPPPESLGPGLEEQVKPALEAAAAEQGMTSGLTGYQLLSQGESSDSDAPSVLTETLLGGLGALGVLAFVFASLLALMPLVIAAVSILTTFLIVLGLTTFTDVSFVVQYLIALVGLGVAIDYSLLLVNRWREEHDRGADNHSAVVTSVRTAGRAVLASGGTVAISLLALIVIPVPLLRSMGIGGLLIPLVSCAVVLTLLPVMLSTIGPRVDWPRIRKETNPARGWSAWARMIVRFRWVAAGAALAMLGLLIAPVFGIAIGQSSSASLARSGSTYEALQTLQNDGVGTGVLTPMVVLVHGDGQAAAAAAADVEGVRTAVAGPERDGLTVVDVVPDSETVDSTSNEVVNRLHDAVSGTPGFVGVAGDGATVKDYDKAVYRNFPYVLAVIAVITYVLLVRTFRSLLLPLKAVVLNLVSVAAVFGAVVFFWQHGHGSDQIFNVSATSAITFWLPPLIFAFVFGLSMDYEVFILSRMREEYDRTGSTYQAVVTGLGRTGRLVTSAALILFFAFIALSASPGTDVKVFATALGVGILIDATLVRALLVPALVSVFGRWNWWLPNWPARLLRVQPSPLAPARSARLTELGPEPEPEPEPAKAGLPRE
jgi:putative drug exporter of the RND superfamily